MRQIIDEYGEVIVSVVIGIPMIGIMVASLIIITVNI